MNIVAKKVWRWGMMKMRGGGEEEEADEGYMLLEGEDSRSVELYHRPSRSAGDGSSAGCITIMTRQNE